jgi:hypothetical protein
MVMGRRDPIPCVTETRMTKWMKMMMMKVKMTTRRKAKKKLQENVRRTKPTLRPHPACYHVPLGSIPRSPPSHLLKANAKNIPGIQRKTQA